VIEVSHGEFAGRANGSVMMNIGETYILACSTMDKKARAGIDFLPLVVNYEEKMYAVGKVPGGFIRREGKPTENAILASRLIDRSLRPLFPKGLNHEVQIVASAVSVEMDYEPEILAVNAASLAVAISDIPLELCPACVCVGRVDGEFIINPNEEERGLSDLNLKIAGTSFGINMVECLAIEFGHMAIKKLIA
jgi:polyribonucleotide nucleotidyltransferase